MLRHSRRESQDVDYLPMLDTLLQLVPKSGKPAHLTFKNAHDPSAFTLRFGDATHESVGARRARGHAPDGGAELLQVLCGAAKKNTCISVNRVFYVRGGKWWCSEQEGTACVPKTNGWCAAKAAFAPRSEFPSVPPA